MDDGSNNEESRITKRGMGVQGTIQAYKLRQVVVGGSSGDEREEDDGVLL